MECCKRPLVFSYRTFTRIVFPYSVASHLIVLRILHILFHWLSVVSSETSAHAKAGFKCHHPRLKLLFLTLILTLIGFWRFWVTRTACLPIYSACCRLISNIKTLTTQIALPPICRMYYCSGGCSHHEAINTIFPTQDTLATRNLFTEQKPLFWCVHRMYTHGNRPQTPSWQTIWNTKPIRRWKSQEAQQLRPWWESCAYI